MVTSGTPKKRKARASYGHVHDANVMRTVPDRITSEKINIERRIVSGKMNEALNDINKPNYDCKTDNTN